MYGLKRSRFEMTISVLQEICKDSMITHIMYSCNTSWLPLNKIIEDLAAKELIIYGSGKRGLWNRKGKMVTLTQKGQDCLKAYEDLMKFFN